MELQGTQVREGAAAKAMLRGENGADGAPSLLQTSAWHNQTALQPKRQRESAIRILSIQSWVCYGHVGNASAVFPMQRMGVDVIAVNTVQFSNHLGYGRHRGQVYSGEDISELVLGLDEIGALSDCAGVLSGYIGDVAIGNAVLDAVRRVRAAKPGALYCCDPVIGDIDSGVFVRPGIPEFMRHEAIRAADIVTPNMFELEYLSGHKIDTLRDLAAAMRAIRDIGPRLVLATSVRLDDTPHDAMDVALLAEDVVLRVRTPLLKVAINGAGDAIAALFLTHLLQNGSPEAALGHAAAATYGLLKQTADANAREILLIAAQDEFVRPTYRFAIERLEL